jgi:DNA processing protein
MEHNRTVFAVPGAVWNPLSWGPNELIRDGAVPVTDADNIIEELFGILPRGSEPDPIKRPVLTHNEEVLLKLLEHDSAQHVDDIARLGHMTASKALPVLLELEIKGLAVQLRGLRFLLAEGNV